MIRQPSAWEADALPIELLSRSTGEGIRTPTGPAAQRILSPPRLPVTTLLQLTFVLRATATTKDKRR